MVVDVSRALAAGAPAVWNEAAGNIACELRHGDAEATAAAFPQGRARRATRPRQPARRAVPDRAARHTRDLRCRHRAPDAHRQLPDAHGVARRTVRSGARHSEGQGARSGRRRRRRLRDEDESLSRGCRHRVLCARAGAPGQMVRIEDGRVPRGVARTRPHEHGGACARQRRQHPRVARPFARERRRLRHRRRRRDPAADRALGGDVDLRHPYRRHPHRGRAHEYRADRRVPGRGTSRGDLHDRAIDGCRSARDRHRSGRASPPQHDPAGTDAVQESAGQDLRQRTIRFGDGPGAPVIRLDRIRRAFGRRPTPRAAARARDGGLPRMDRRRRVRGDGDRHRRRRWRNRNRLRDAGDGTGPRDNVFAACGRRLRRADREDTHRARRHRSRARLRQRRIAFAFRRRIGGARRGRADGGKSAGSRGS